MTRNIFTAAAWSTSIFVLLASHSNTHARTLVCPKINSFDILRQIHNTGEITNDDNVTFDLQTGGIFASPDFETYKDHIVGAKPFQNTTQNDTCLYKLQTPSGNFYNFASADFAITVPAPDALRTCPKITNPQTIIKILKGQETVKDTSKFSYNLEAGSKTVILNDDMEKLITGAKSTRPKPNYGRCSYKIQAKTGNLTSGSQADFTAEVLIIE